jgi:glutathione S-transferase
MPRLKLYEFVNAKGDSTSPFVWRTKFALQAKGIPYDSVPDSFLDIPRIGGGSGEPGTQTVPIVEYQGELLHESWTIAEWLDRAFPDLPSLFASAGELAMIRFFDKWFGTQVLPRMFRSCVFEIFETVRPGEQDYFRRSRERLLGQTLEEIAADAERYITETREALLPMRLALLMVSPDDHVVPPSNANVILEGIRSKDARKLVLDNSFHVATIDYDKEVIAEQTRRFFKEQLSARSQ